MRGHGDIKHDDLTWNEPCSTYLHVHVTPALQEFKNSDNMLLALGLLHNMKFLACTNRNVTHPYMKSRGSA